MRVAIKVLSEMEQCWQLQTVSAREIRNLAPAIGKVRHHRYFFTADRRFWNDQPYILVLRLRAENNTSTLMPFMGVGGPLLLENLTGLHNDD